MCMIVGNSNCPRRISLQEPLMPRFRTIDMGSSEICLAATLPLGPIALPSKINVGSSPTNQAIFPVDVPGIYSKAYFWYSFPSYHWLFRRVVALTACWYGPPQYAFIDVVL